MNAKLQRRLKRSSDMLEHADEQFSPDLQVCPTCGAASHPPITGDSMHKESSHLCVLQYQPLGRRVNSFRYGSRYPFIPDEGRVLKKRRTTQIDNTQGDHALDKFIPARSVANCTDHHSSTVDAGSKHPPEDNGIQHDCSAPVAPVDACLPSDVELAERPSHVILGENQVPGFTSCSSTRCKFVHIGSPDKLLPAHDFPPRYGRIGVLPASPKSRTSETTTNAEAPDETSRTAAEINDCVPSLIKQQQLLARSTEPAIGNDDTSDPLKNPYLLPSSPETPLSCNVWGQLRALSYWPHNCVRLGKSSSLTWATQFKDIISANEGFVLQWSVPEQALQILARLHNEIQSPGYQLPSLLFGISSCHESYVQVLSGTLPAYTEVHDTPVIATLQPGKNQVATLGGKPREGGTTEHANDPVQSTLSPSPQASPSTALSLSASRQDSVLRDTKGCITESTSSGSTHACPDAQTTHTHLPRSGIQGSVMAGVANPDPKVRTECDELDLISLVDCRLRAFRDQRESLEQENACLRYQVATLRKDLDTLGQARLDDLRRRCETIERLHGLVKQHEKRRTEDKESILRLTDDVNCTRKRSRRDYVLYHLNLASTRRELGHTKLRLAKVTSRIPAVREFSDIGVSTDDTAQYVSTGIMHQPVTDVRSRGVQVCEPAVDSMQQEPQGGDYRGREATREMPRVAGDAEGMDAGLRLKLAEAELCDLRAKLAFYEGSSANLPVALSSSKLPVNPSIIAERHTVPGFIESVARLERGADRYLRRQRKRAEKLAAVPAINHS